MTRPKIIFFGNGLLADSAKSILSSSCDIIFHAREKADLETVKTLKQQHKEAFGILASFGAIVPSSVFDLFEPQGILNIHPSLLPLYRGASPIESAILNGDASFSVSIMKIVKAMDAGPIYHQETLTDLPLDKTTIYTSLASAGASWIINNLQHLPAPKPQDHSRATFTKKLDKSMSYLTPDLDSADLTLRKIVAYQGFPKPKYSLYNQEVIVLSAHIAPVLPKGSLGFKCADQQYIIVDKLQPISRKPMDAKSFLNGLHLS